MTQNQKTVVTLNNWPEKTCSVIEGHSDEHHALGMQILF